mmetsp:Transcript_3626/g.8387  ORF Transcript_3626/g.8387 Transcript_3626/m.8387 type:complete len:204 (+) Transcript_3626:117-728(+)
MSALARFVRLLLSCCTLGLRCFWPGRDDLSVLIEHTLEIGDGLCQTLLHVNLWFPSQLPLGGGNVWFSLGGIVGDLGKVNDLRIGLGHCLNLLRKVLDAVFVGIAKVDRPVVWAVHELHQTLDEVRHILKGPRLGPVAVDGNVLPLQRLDDEIAHDTAVVGVHPRPERVEDARDADLDVVLVLVGIHHRLRHSLALVVAGAGS